MYEGWSREKRRLPAHLSPLAAHHAGGEIAEIDGKLVSDPNGYVPVEAIAGVYEISTKGKPTGIYWKNPKYGNQITDDWSKLQVDGLVLDWLPGDPKESVLAAMIDSFSNQVPGTVIEWVHVTSDPKQRLIAIPDPESSEKGIVIRAAIAFSFEASIVSPSSARESLSGSFSWAAVGLSGTGQRKDRTWFDKDEVLKWLSSCSNLSTCTEMRSDPGGGSLIRSVARDHSPASIGRSRALPPEARRPSRGRKTHSAPPTWFK